MYSTAWRVCLLAAAFPFFLFAQKIQTAEVRPLNSRPVLLVNGRPELPFFYALTHAVGGRWSWEELPAHNLRQMASAGIRLYQVDLWLADLWHENERRLDLTLARRQIRGVLDACPGAAVVVRLHVNAPGWWNRRYPEECVQFADGPTEERPEGLPFNHEDGDTERGVRASLASERWRAEAGARAAEFCRRLAGTREGRAVIGVHVAGGVYGEWHPWGFVKYEPDVSAPMQRAFRQWLRDKYSSDDNLQRAWNDPSATLGTATVPDNAARQCCSDTNTIFRDPARERRLLDFYACQQAVVADDIEFFCRTVKENWPRPLIVGVFFGYVQFGLCRHALGGHLEAERLLDSPWIDYFAGPPSYLPESRKAGGSGLQRAPVRSVLLHGKLWFDEVDNGYLQDKREQDFVRSRPLGDSAYLPVLQRSLWLPLVQGCGLWLYDFGPRRNAGWWDSPLYRAEIRRTREFFEKQLSESFQFSESSPAADVLVVWDTESFYHVENRWTRTCERGLDAAAEDLQRSGVASDHIYGFDLSKIDLQSYRAVVFMNAWMLTPEQRIFIRDSVARAGRTVVWNYLAGYSDGTRTGQDLAENLTGFVFQKMKNPDTLRWRLGDFEFVNPERVEPFFAVRDPAAETLARLTGPDAEAVAVCRKSRPDHTVVCATAPLHGRAVWRSIFREAGCHVFSESEDAVFAAGDFLLAHTGGGGERVFQVSKKISLILSARAPASWLIRRADGAIIFP